jgi:glycosyltransferase involved in cell wall biosynthesis
LPSIIQRAIQGLGRLRRPKGALLLVVDDAGWILDEIGQQLAPRLPHGLNCQTVSGEWIAARDCTVHFLNRVWAWTDGVLDRAHPSNRLIGVWWHGRADSPDPAMQAALRRLSDLHHRFDRIQVTCSIARRTLEAIGVPLAKIVTLPVGVDLLRFRPVVDEAAKAAARRKLGVGEGSAAIGCFQKDGSGWKDDAEPKLIKGPDIFVDAIVSLNRRTPVHAVIPGPARGYVRRRLEQAGVSLSAPGFVAREDLPQLYHALDVYCSPSRDEGGPAGVLEAMASGVPVVASRAGMPADMIESGVNGALVDVGDAEAMAFALAELIADEGRRAACAAGGLSTIQSYDWPLVAARYASELYEPVHAAPVMPRMRS